MSVSPLIS